MPRVTLDWLHVIALLGAIQGVFLAGALAIRRPNQTANRLLAAAIFAFSLYLATGVYYAAGLVPVFPHFFAVGYPVLLLFGPLIYLYAVTASDRSRRLTRRDLLHFAPFVIAVIWGFPVYLMSGAEKVAFFEGILRGERTLLITIVDPLKLVSGIVYAAVTIVLLRRHRDRVKHNYSYLERVNLQWLLWLGVSAGAIWGLAIVFQLLDSTLGLRLERADDLIAVAVAILVYGIGYMGLRQPEIFRFESTKSSTAPVSAAAETAVTTSATEPARYERSGLNDREASALKDALLAVMESKRPWENSELTLSDLAELLRTTPHKVSEVLNVRLGQTFYDFVNGYRVREVQRRMEADRAQAPTLLMLALEAGFASKSTFNDAFKKHAGQTPSQYRRAIFQ
jgi:AraC-like DNA-binding protein